MAYAKEMDTTARFSSTLALRRLAKIDGTQILAGREGVTGGRDDFVGVRGIPGVNGAASGLKRERFLEV